MVSATAGEIVLQWVGIITLVSLSALFAGLTLGIMSLDITGLEVWCMSALIRTYSPASRLLLPAVVQKKAHMLRRFIQSEAGATFCSALSS